VSGVLECPRERSGHRIIYHDGAIFAFGGYNPSLEEDEEMQKDVDWQTSKPLFKELWHQFITLFVNYEWAKEGATTLSIMTFSLTTLSITLK